jgi:hypothetical protein
MKAVMSANMKLILRSAAAAALLVIGCAQLPPAAIADPVPPPAPAPAPPQDQHNVTYRARVDGVSRGALITYKISDSQVQSADPTMLPGRTFEAQTVLTDGGLAGMQVSIQWPYSANLHCEILVDDAIVAQADQFIRPRLTPADDDPDYGKLMCGAPLTDGIGSGPTPSDTPLDGGMPAPDQPAPEPVAAG